MGEVIDIVNRICTKCGEEKIENEDNFRIRKINGKYISRCLICLKEDNAKYHKEYDEKVKENPPEREFPEEKECTKCGVLKKLNEENYHFHKIRRYFESACKECANKDATKRYDEKLNKQGKIKKVIVKIDKDATHKNCTECKKIKNIKNDYYFMTAENRFQSKCKECILKYNNIRLSKPKNKTKKAQINKVYKKNNPEKIKIHRKKRSKKPRVKIRRGVSSAIRTALNLRNQRKNGSITKYLPYSIDELMIHLEAQFELWMTWQNRGMYNPETWDDNNSSTWTWQIDHIIPDSDFEYGSMEDVEFQKSWSLENLRPLNSKQNVLEGTNRTRHTKPRKNNNKNN